MHLDLNRPVSCLAVRMVMVCAIAACAQPALAAPYDPDAATPGEQAVAGALDAIPASAAPYTALRGSLDALPDSAARADALGQLTPRNYRLLPRLVIESMNAADREIRGYLVQRRAMARGAGAEVPVSGERTITFMGSLGLKQMHYEARPDRAAANADSRSIRAGLDFAPTQGLIAGVTLGIDGIDANLDRRQRPRIHQFNVQIGPYASYTSGRFFVDATALYNRSSTKLRRQIGWTNFSNQLTTGQVDGDSAAATVETGASLSFGAVQAEPFVGLHYRYADISGFVERGGAAALAVAPYKAESLRSSLGARIKTSVSSGAWTINPQVEAQWQRELRSHPDSRIEAVFINGGSPIFTLLASRFSRSTAVVQASVSAVHDNRTAIRASYSGTFAADRRVNAFFLSVSRRF